MKEIYGGGGNYRLSKREIEIMKKNMQKVPIIQKKSDVYHKKQDEEADIFIEKSLKNQNLQNENRNYYDGYDKKTTSYSFLEKIFKKIKDLLLKIKNDN